MRLVIEIPKPTSRDGEPTDREDWVQGVSEAAMHGVAAWLAGARLVVPELTLHIDPVVIPKSEDVPF
jgi:hypothetical protein